LPGTPLPSVLIALPACPGVDRVLAAAGRAQDWRVPRRGERRVQRFDNGWMLRRGARYWWLASTAQAFDAQEAGPRRAAGNALGGAQAVLRADGPGLARGIVRLLSFQGLAQRRAGRPERADALMQVARYVQDCAAVLGPIEAHVHRDDAGALLVEARNLSMAAALTLLGGAYRDQLRATEE